MAKSATARSIDTISMVSSRRGRTASGPSVAQKRGALPLDELAAAPEGGGAVVVVARLGASGELLEGDHAASEQGEMVMAPVVVISHARRFQPAGDAGAGKLALGRCQRGLVQDSAAGSSSY